MRALIGAIGPRAAVRVQSSFRAGRYSMPSPTLPSLPGHEPDYDKAHPRTALLLVEVAEWSLPRTALTKLAILRGRRRAGVLDRQPARRLAWRSCVRRIAGHDATPKPPSPTAANALPSRRSRASVAVDELLPGRS